jgi:hypothetical protein
MQIALIQIWRLHLNLVSVTSIVNLNVSMSPEILSRPNEFFQIEVVNYGKY